MNKRIILGVLIFLSGCAFHYNEKAWTGGTPEQIQKDFKECEMYGDAHSDMNAFLAMSLTKQCMENKGYSPKKK